MPTTQNEATHIKKILGDYLSPAKAKKFTERLESEVGRHTENDSLKVTLEMMKELCKDAPPETKLSPSRKKQFFALWALVGFHASILVFNTIAMIILPFVAPWYVALPIITLLGNLMFSPNPCPLTRLESRMRKNLGLPRITHFLKHYLITPIRKQLKGI